jgi:ABC-type sugar transport system permease subunit
MKATSVLLSVSNYWRTVRKHTLEICMTLPTLLYLYGFSIIILYKLVQLALTYVVAGNTSYPSLTNFTALAANPDFNRAFWNTFLFALVGTPLELIAGLVLAMLIYRQFRGRGVVRSFFILPLAIPVIVTATVLYILSDFPSGHINSLLCGKYAFFPAVLDNPINWRTTPAFSLGLSLFGKIWRDMPISMLLLLAGLTTISPEQYEAVETMGGSTFQKFRYITLPSLIPSISMVLILRNVEMWKEFIFPFILAGRFQLLGTLIEEVYHSWRSPTEAAAISIVLILSIAASSAILFMLTSALKRRFFNLYD